MQATDLMKNDQKLGSGLRIKLLACNRICNRRVFCPLSVDLNWVFTHKLNPRMLLSTGICCCVAVWIDNLFCLIWTPLTIHWCKHLKIIQSMHMYILISPIVKYSMGCYRHSCMYICLSLIPKLSHLQMESNRKVGGAWKRSYIYLRLLLHLSSSFTFS